MKKIIYMMLVTVMAAGIALPGANVSAQSIQEYEEEIKQLEKEKGSLDNKRNKVEKEKESVSKEKGNNQKKQMSVVEQMEVITKDVKETEKKIKKKNDEIDKTNKEIKALEAEIKKLKKEIKELKIRIKEREEMLSSRLQSIQEVGGEVQYLEVILGSKSFSDLISRSSAVNTVMDSDKVILEEHAADKKALETKEKEVKENKKSLEDKKAKQVKEKEKLSDMKKKLEGQKKKQAKIKAELEKEFEGLEYAELTLTEEQALIAGEASALEQAKQIALSEKGNLEAAERQRIADAKAAQKAAAQKEAQRQAAAANKKSQKKQSSNTASSQSTSKSKTASKSVAQAAPAPVSNAADKPKSSSGNFGIPASGRLSSGFNPARVHPISGQVRPHNGMDIAAPTGTPVYASASGVVSSAGYRGGFGNTVMITHSINGKSYTTLYAHLSSISVSGGKVSRGQQIGKVGSTGASTGPHLHFELHSGGYGNPVNPRNYVNF